MASKKKPQQSLADYVTIALSPVLIMALVGSLVFFLLEVLYVGQYSGRMQWTLFFFVFGIVLIARISIDQGGGKAMLYGMGMSFAVWLALQAFIEYPAGSPLRALSWAINFALIAVAWWCAHRLTWDCTYIDDRVDASGKGVLEAAGLEEPSEDAKADPASTIEDQKSDGDRTKPGRGLFAWWDRYSRYRQEQLRKPHTPGVWVVYFSLAALPLFGLGQALISAGDVARRRYVFWLMVCYVASGLALLVTTSFLGLRRYLRQRKLKMPAAMTGIWMGLAGALIVLMMVTGALLPRPYGEYQLIGFNTGTKDRDASKYAVLREGAGKGEGQPSSNKGGRAKDGRPASGNRPDDTQGDSSDGKSSGGKSGQGGKGGGKQSNQQGAADDAKSDRQNSSQRNSRSEEQKDDRNSKQTDAGGPNRREDQEKGRSGSSKPGKDGAEGGSDPGQSRSTNALPHNPVSQVLEKLGWLGTVLKWLVFAVVALVVLFVVLRSGLQFLANFTNWAKNLLEAFQAWWQSLFGRTETEPETELEQPLRQPAPRPFASFTNPFLDGRADQLSPDELARYSFEALQAWAWEHDLGRQPEETPLEFTERLCARVPKLEEEVRGLAGLYVRLAYARSSLAPAGVGVLKRFWQRLESMEEKFASA